MDTSDYFECPKLKARLQISACLKYRVESKERCPAGKLPKHALACASCTEHEKYHEVSVAKKVYENQVLKELGGEQELFREEELKGNELYEKRRRNSIANETYWRY